jgi:thiamine-phosphate pyrophosphorylase
LAAIGGIEAGNAKALIDAGADLLAVIGGVCAADDPEAAARAISKLFGKT